MLSFATTVVLTLADAADGAASAPGKWQPVRFIVKRFKYSEAGCGRNRKEECGRKKLEYPIVKGGSAALRSAVNAHVLKFVFGDPPYPRNDRQIRRDVVAAGAGLAEARRNCESDQRVHTFQGGREVRVLPDCGDAPWSESSYIVVLLNKPFSFTILEEDLWYTGGAPHPNTSVAHHNYDPKTGREIRFEHIFTNSGLVELERIAERTFREQLLNSPGGMVENGYFLHSNGRFYLSYDFFLLDRELGVWWDRGQMGLAAEIRIPYRTIRHLVRPEWRAFIR
jgi:hypothetical protein